MRTPGRWVLALVSVMVLGAACGGTGGDTQQTPSSGPVSGPVSFLLFGEPEELQAYRDLVDRFKEVEPDVTVNLVEASDRDDLIARLSTSFAGGTPPDLFLLNYRFYAQFAVKNVLEPLQSRLDASAAFQPDDFYPQAMEAFQVDGQQICMPQNISSLVVYYNKDLFSQAGVAEPAEGWTWDDMRAAGHSLTKDLDGDGVLDQYGLGVEASIIRVAPFVWSNGAELVDDELKPTQFTVDSPKGVEALQKFFDLHQTDLIVPGDEELESEDNESRFMNGTMGMILQSRRVTPEFRTITGFDWDIAPLPQLAEPAGILHSDAYCMTTASKSKEAAWKFVEFALGPEGSPIPAGVGRTVPSLRSVAESEAFLDPAAKPANSRVFLDTIESIRRVPNVSTWPEIEDVVAGIIEAGLYDGLDPAEVARRMIEETRDIFARAE